MIVYGDILFAENFIIGCVLLYITSEIFGLHMSGAASKARLAAGGALCGAFSMTVFLAVPMSVTALSEIAFAFAVCLTAFGRKDLWRRAAVFVLVTFFMGGLSMGLLYIAESPGIYTGTGIYTGDMKAGLLALFIGTGLFTAKRVIKTVKAKKFYGEHIFDVRIHIGGSVFETKGFFDTGNRLADPLTGRPAAVAQESLWRRFEEAGVIAPERMGVIPYETVGGRGVMASVRTDSIEVGGRRFAGSLIAKGDVELGIRESAAGECELLLSENMTDRGN